MNQAEIIQGQIELLIQLNQELASQTTPEAAREVRENVKLIVELLERVSVEADLEERLEALVSVEADLEERLEVLEEALFGDEEPGEGMERLAEMVTVETILQAIIDCRDDINAIAGTAGD